MRRLALPIYQASDVFTQCIRTVTDLALFSQLESIRNQIHTAEINYSTHAFSHNLHLVVASQTAAGIIPKEVMKALYTDGLVNKVGPCRGIYDYLMALPPGGLCPYCLNGWVYTLDHLLPKNSFPELAVTPKNLVASCRDCNTVKGKRLFRDPTTQIIHPYFDQIPVGKWLYATVNQTNPLTITYSVDAPAFWSNEYRLKVASHFKIFKLSRAFALSAVQDLIGMRATLIATFEAAGVQGVKRYLELELLGKRDIHTNSWQTALLEALAGDDWFCHQGFYQIAAPL